MLFSEEGCPVRLEVSGDEGLVLVLWGLGVCFEGWECFSYITSLGKTTSLQVGLRTEGLV